MQLLLLPVTESFGSPLHAEQVGPKREGGPTHCASLTFHLHSSGCFDNSPFAENEK